MLLPANSGDRSRDDIGLPRRWNELFLTVIELLAFRSGHAYRLAHLHYHSRFPHDDDDIEGAAAKMGFWRTILEGVVFQPRIVVWALRRRHQLRYLVVVEVAVALALLAGCFAAWPWTPIFSVYAVLMVVGG